MTTDSKDKINEDIDAKIQACEDPSEEELEEELANEKKAKLVNKKFDIISTKRFYKRAEKDQKFSLREGQKLTIKRNLTINEFINNERESKQEEKERIIHDIKELLLKKKNPGYKRNLFKNED